MYPYGRVKVTTLAIFHSSSWPVTPLLVKEKQHFLLPCFTVFTPLSRTLEFGLLVVNPLNVNILQLLLFFKHLHSQESQRDIITGSTRLKLEKLFTYMCLGVSGWEIVGSQQLAACMSRLWTVSHFFLCHRTFLLPRLLLFALFMSIFSFKSKVTWPHRWPLNWTITIKHNICIESNCALVWEQAEKWASFTRDYSGQRRDVKRHVQIYTTAPKPDDII